MVLGELKDECFVDIKSVTSKDNGTSSVKLLAMTETGILVSINNDSVLDKWVDAKVMLHWLGLLIPDSTGRMY